MALKDADLRGVPQDALRRMAWRMELGDRVLAAQAAEHKYGAEAIILRGRVGWARGRAR